MSWISGIFSRLFVEGIKSSGEEARKIPITAYLLDNLWLWVIVVFIIALIYGAWALIETVHMHVPPGITPK